MHEITNERRVDTTSLWEAPSNLLIHMEEEQTDLGFWGVLPEQSRDLGGGSDPKPEGDD